MLCVQVKIEAENERMLETAATLFGSKPVAEIQHICKGGSHFAISEQVLMFEMEEFKIGSFLLVV